MHRLHQENKYVLLAAPASIATGAAVTPIAIDGRTFDRIAILCAKNSPTGATKNTVRLTIYKSATTGGTYTKVTASDGTYAAAATNKVGIVIDASIDPDKPFMKVYGTGGGLGTAATVVGLIACLYKGSRSLPVTQEYTTTAPVIIA
ncbi:MAG TPA: hypothetical protein VJP78_04730 [Thermoleophilia bacterium]|nr:hypothetical protein [Thermoleophilia bacterium]